MEYGYGLFKWNNNDGVKNTVISNCSITLNRINNSSAGVVMPVGSNGIVMMNVTANNAQAFLVPTDVKGSNSKTNSIRIISVIVIMVLQSLDIHRHYHHSTTLIRPMILEEPVR